MNNRDLKNIVDNQIACCHNREYSHDSGNKQCGIFAHWAALISWADTGNNIVFVCGLSSKCITGIAGFHEKLLQFFFHGAAAAEHNIGCYNAGVIIIHRIGIGKQVGMVIYKGFRHDNASDIT